MFVSITLDDRTELRLFRKRGVLYIEKVDVALERTLIAQQDDTSRAILSEIKLMPDKQIEDFKAAINLLG